MFDIIIAVAGTYGLATIVADYDGPFGVFEKIRGLGRGFSYNVCLMPYFALIPTLGMGLGFFEYLAIVGTGVAIARVT